MTINMLRIILCLINSLLISDALGKFEGKCAVFIFSTIPWRVESVDFKVPLRYKLKFYGPVACASITTSCLFLHTDDGHVQYLSITCYLEFPTNFNHTINKAGGISLMMPNRTSACSPLQP